jgi:CelD/BcsL family acetyltransferase involved in cellulose biosynthesis
VVALGEAAEPTALLIGRLEDVELPARFGYATLFRPTLRCLTVVSGGLAGPDEAAPALMASALGALKAKEADAVLLHRIAIGSPLHRAALEQSPRRSVHRPLVTTPHWVADLPDSFDAFLRSKPKKLRDDLRRYGRRLDRTFGDRAAIRCVRDPAELETLLTDLESIAARSYQRGLDAGFSAADDRPLVELGLRRGWLRAWVLSIDGIPVAFELGTLRNGTFLVWAKAYDPAFAEHHIGKVVQMRMIEDLCEDPEATALDFGFGDADYKRRLATRSWDEADVLIYGSTPRARMARTARTTVASADLAVRRLAGPERIAQVKRRWRHLRTPATA